MKACPKCGNPDAVFFKRQKVCKDCCSGRMKEWRVTMRNKDLQGAISKSDQIEINQLWRLTSASTQPGSVSSYRE